MSNNMSKLYMRRDRLGEISRKFAVKMRGLLCDCGARSLDFAHHKRECGYFKLFDDAKKEQP